MARYEEFPVQSQQNYTAPSVEDFIPNPPIKPTPLQFWPGFQSIWLPLTAVLLFIFASLPFWAQTPVQGLWVSKASLLSEPWRLVTSLFAHADFSHLLSNSLPFVFLAWILSGYYGNKTFPIASLVAGLIANGLAIMTYESNVRLLGASGMVFAMYGIWLVLFLRLHGGLTAKSRLVRVIGFAALTLAPTGITENTNISHAAHYFGLAAGVGIGLYMAPKLHIQEKKIPKYQQALRTYEIRHNTWQKNKERMLAKIKQEELEFQAHQRYLQQLRENQQDNHTTYIL